MLAQIVFIASFLAVCIRNSEGDARIHECDTDDKAVEKIQQFPHGIIPILLIQNGAPMTIYSDLRKFINTWYNDLIIVINANNSCTHTDNALSNRFDTKIYPGLYMMKEGQLVKRHRVSCFRDHFLYAIKNAAVNYILRTKGVTSLSQQILSNMPKPIHHPGIQMGNPLGYPMGNPAEIYRPNYPGIEPQYGTKRNRSFDQGQSSDQPRHWMTTPMLNYQNFEIIRSNVSQTTLPNQSIKPTAVYPEKQEIPKTLNLLDSIDKPQGHENVFGGSLQTLSKNQSFFNLNKRPRLDEGPFGGSRSRSRSRS